MARKTNEPKTLPLQERQRLYCPEHNGIFDVVRIEKSENVYGYLLSCDCSRGRYLSPKGVSLEHASSPEGIAAFQADRKLDMANAQFGKYRQQLSEEL